MVLTGVDGRCVRVLSGVVFLRHPSACRSRACQLNREQFGAAPEHQNQVSSCCAFRLLALDRCIRHGKSEHASTRQDDEADGERKKPDGRQPSLFLAIHFITLGAVEVQQYAYPKSHRHLNSSSPVPQICQPADARCSRRPIPGVAMTCICTPRVLGRLPPARVRWTWPRRPIERVRIREPGSPAPQQ